MRDICDFGANFFFYFIDIWHYLAKYGLHPFFTVQPYCRSRTLEKYRLVHKSLL